MRSNGRKPLRTSQLVPTRVSLYAGERPQVACPICGAWRWLRRGVLSPHRAADEITRCPGSGQPVLVDEDVHQWRHRLGKAAASAMSGAQERPFVATRPGLKPQERPNGRPRLHLSEVDARRVRLVEPDTCRVACPLCGRWRYLQPVPRLLEREGLLGAHRADDGITRCPGSGQRVLMDETPQRWHARLQHTLVEAARLAPAVAALQQHQLDLDIELPESPIMLRSELAGV